MSFDSFEGRPSITIDRNVLLDLLAFTETFEFIFDLVAHSSQFPCQAAVAFSQSGQKAEMDSCKAFFSSTADACGISTREA